MYRDCLSIFISIFTHYIFIRGVYKFSYIFVYSLFLISYLCLYCSITLVSYSYILFTRSHKFFYYYILYILYMHLFIVHILYLRGYFINQFVVYCSRALLKSHCNCSYYSISVELNNSSISFYNFFHLYQPRSYFLLRLLYNLFLKNKNIYNI